MSTLESESAVHRLIARFANSLDAQTWDELGACLADSVYTDYSDVRGSPPEAISPADFVDACRNALAHVKTHHLTGNVEIYINGTSATARVSAIVFRRQEAEQAVERHCQYLLGLQMQRSDWVICSIVQKMLWSEDGVT